MATLSASLMPQTAPLPLAQKRRNRWRDRQRILRARARSDGRGLRQTLPLVQLCAARGAPSDVAVGVDGQPRSVPRTVWEPCVARARPAPGRASCPGQARPAARARGILDDRLTPRCAAPKGAVGDQVARDIPARRTPALSWRSAASSAASGCWPGCFGTIAPVAVGSLSACVCAPAPPPGGIRGRSEELLRGRKLGVGAKLTFNVGPLNYAPSPSSASIPELVRECRTQFSLPLV